MAISDLIGSSIFDGDKYSSKYFRVSFDDTFKVGKNAVSINPDYSKLQRGTQIQFEAVASDGSNLTYTVEDFIGDTGSRVINVEVSKETPQGPGKLYISGNGIVWLGLIEIVTEDSLNENLGDGITPNEITVRVPTDLIHRNRDLIFEVEYLNDEGVLSDTKTEILGVDFAGPNFVMTSGDVVPYDILSNVPQGIISGSSQVSEILNQLGVFSGSSLLNLYVNSSFVQNIPVSGSLSFSEADKMDLSFSSPSGVPTVNISSGGGTSGTSGGNTSGTSGSRRTSGTAGGPGPTGPIGPTGSSNTSGTSAQNGATGPNQTSGARSPNRTSGLSRSSGSSGSSGTSGISASPGSGPPHPQGQGGLSRTSGTSGLNYNLSNTSGTSGTSGNAGANGPPGNSGTSGSSPTGPIGNSGSSGSNGPTGPGAHGSSGSSGLTTTGSLPFDFFDVNPETYFHDILNFNFFNFDTYFVRTNNTTYVNYLQSKKLFPFNQYAFLTYYIMKYVIEKWQ